MGDISKHFSRKEFACSCGCGFQAVDIKLVELLEKIRLNFGNKPIVIHCACRCKNKNDEVNSKDTSYHLRGMAVDFHINGIDNKNIYNYCNSIMIGWGGIGLYEWGIHIDVGEGGNKVNNRPARWG